MAHTNKEFVLALTPLYEGKAHGDDGYWLDVEFSNLVAATLCIHNHLFEHVARIRSDENGVSQVAFNKPVVIQFKIREDDDA